MPKVSQEVILQHQKRRRRTKIILGTLGVVFLVIAIALISIYFIASKNEYNKYNEKAKVDYKVNLKENEFYDDKTVDGKMSVVASLIKNIEVGFKYNLNLENSQDYIYSYKIIAKTDVKEGSRANSVYETSQELLSKELKTSSSPNLEISEKVVIDYNEYNEKINRFINMYNLDNTSNALELSMYVYVTNIYDNERINKESKVMTLNIPLTTKTVDISINSNVIEDEGKILSKRSEYQNIEWMLLAGLVVLVIGLIFFARLIVYTLVNRRAETIYRQELKKILFNYKSYIQQTNSEIDSKNYKIIQINTFEEILGMRETMQSPILMYTDEAEERTKFMIINDGILYVYVLGAKEIREDLRAKSAMKQENKK